MKRPLRSKELKQRVEALREMLGVLETNKAILKMLQVFCKDRQSIFSQTSPTS
jgi:hypothetical protein